eukprot:1329282-Rhodomonas_salina.1
MMVRCQVKESGAARDASDRASWTELRGVRWRAEAQAGRGKVCARCPGRRRHCCLSGGRVEAFALRHAP